MDRVGKGPQDKGGPAATWEADELSEASKATHPGEERDEARSRSDSLSRSPVYPIGERFHCGCVCSRKHPEVGGGPGWEEQLGQEEPKGAC